MKAKIEIAIHRVTLVGLQSCTKMLKIKVDAMNLKS